MTDNTKAEHLGFEAVLSEEHGFLGVGAKAATGGGGEGESGRGSDVAGAGGGARPREVAGDPDSEPTALSEGLSALCLSGGGIRSAAFALGVIAGLAKQGVLGRFHYLSTVSGGGYTGSWLSAWAVRHERGMAGVIAELAAHAGDPDGDDCVDDDSEGGEGDEAGVKRAPVGAGGRGAGDGRRRSPSGEGLPITFVRRYASYLSPRWGVISADTWTVIGIYLRNLLITAVVLVPLMGAGLMLPWLNYSMLEATSSAVGSSTGIVGCSGLRACLFEGLGLPPIVLSVLLLSGALLAITVAVSHAQRVNRPEESEARDTDPDSDGFATEINGDARIVAYFMLPGMLSFVVLTWVLSTVSLSWALLAIWGSLVTGAGILIGFADEWWTRWRRAGDPAAAAPAEARSKPFKRDRKTQRLLQVRAIQFVAAVVAGAGGGWLSYAVSTWLLRAPGTRDLVSRLFIPKAEDGQPLIDRLPKVPGVEAGNADAILDAILMMFQATVGPLVLIGVGLAACTAFVGLCSRGTDTQDREYWARAGAWALIGMLVQVVYNLVALFGPIIFDGSPFALGTRNASLTAWGVVSGLITAAAGMSPTGGSGGGNTRGEGRLKRLVDVMTAIGAPLFLLQVLVVVAIWNRATLMLLVERFGGGVPFSLPPEMVLAIGWMFALLLFMVVAGWFINLNEFSLHGLYKVRLIRTFIGASRLFENERRRPNRFTGFDMDDDMKMSTLAEPRERDNGRKRLFHVINMALNVGRGGDLGLQYRKALPFTVSALHAGYGMYVDGDPNGHPPGHYRRTGPRLGSVDPGPEEGEGEGEVETAPNAGAAAPPSTAPVTTRKRRILPLWPSEKEVRYFGNGISIGTAMTISGAAASPNMGYHSSPVVTYLLTLLNARLGRWLGNTSDAGENVFDHEHPGQSIRPVLSEAFGLTSTKSPWIFLSDGGHFDNLGLYAMVARRCRFILVSDASGDPGYSWNDLARAVQLVRIDFGVDISFEEPPRDRDASAHDDFLLPEAAAKVQGLARRFRVGCIHYSRRYPDMEDGVLVVLKPVVTEVDPVDIRNYRNRSKAFPHDSTVVQWYSEEQFEAYRKLGETTAAGLTDFLAECAKQQAAGRDDRHGTQDSSAGRAQAWFEDTPAPTRR